MLILGQVSFAPQGWERVSQGLEKEKTPQIIFNNPRSSIKTESTPDPNDLINLRNSIIIFFLDF